MKIYFGLATTPGCVNQKDGAATAIANRTIRFRQRMITGRLLNRYQRVERLLFWLLTGSRQWGVK
jgi:hypothetical protein